MAATRRLNPDEYPAWIENKIEWNEKKKELVDACVENEKRFRDDFTATEQQMLLNGHSLLVVSLYLSLSLSLSEFAFKSHLSVFIFDHLNDNKIKYR